jgi:hypothetical protein
MNNSTLFPTDQRGVALPMAMLALLILSTLVIGFSMLSATEPTIANNQLMVAQARSLAEAGVERALWALNNPADANGIPNSPPLAVSWTAPAAYSGGQLISVSTGGNTIGGFKVTVASQNTVPLPTGCSASMSAAELCVVSVGWVPSDTSSRAHQRVIVTVFNPQFLFKDPPAALSVRGELQAGGNSLVDSRSDNSCGPKSGTLTTGNTSMNGNAADIYGYGDDTRNQVYDANNGNVPSTPADIVKDVSTQAFDNYIWSDADISALRAYAKAHGTYLQGTVTFNAGNKIPNGVVFVDTVSGNNITQEGVSPATPSSDFASVDIHGNPPADPSGVFSGTLFVNGSLSIDGNFQMHGLVYAQNDISYHGVGTGGVWGAAISRNIRDTSSTSIDSDLLGNALINYNCAYAKTGGGSLVSKWSVEKGTYREPCDSCT